MNKVYKTFTLITFLSLLIMTGCGKAASETSSTPLSSVQTTKLCEVGEKTLLNEEGQIIKLIRTDPDCRQIIENTTYTSFGAISKRVRIVSGSPNNNFFHGSTGTSQINSFRYNDNHQIIESKTEMFLSTAPYSGKLYQMKSYETDYETKTTTIQFFSQNTPFTLSTTIRDYKNNETVIYDCPDKTTQTIQVQIVNEKGLTIEQNLLLSEPCDKDNINLRKKTFYYNLENKLVKTITIEQDGKIQRKTAYQYNVIDKLSEEVTTDKNENIIEKVSYNYNAEGNLIKRSSSNGSEEQYNDEGKLVKKIDTSDNSPVTYVYYTDSYSHIRKQKEGDIEYTIETIYKKNTHKILKKIKRHNDTIISKSIFEYNPNNTIKKEIKTFNEGNLITTHTYNTNNKVTKIHHNYLNGKESFTTYTYDDYGRKIEEKTYDIDGNIKIKTKSYNDNLYQITEKFINGVTVISRYSNTTPQILIERKHLTPGGDEYAHFQLTYLDNGHVLKVNTQIDDGYITKKSYEYDQSGFTIKILNNEYNSKTKTNTYTSTSHYKFNSITSHTDIVYNKDGNINYTSKREYNNKGKMIKETRTDADGNII